MLSSTAGEDTGYNSKTKTLHRLSSSSSSSSSKSSSTSSSSSPTPFSPSNNSTTLLYHSNNHNNTQQKSKTMEEVWKDIASLHDHPSTDQDFSRLHNLPSSHHHNPNFILQDFFARPTKTVSTSTTTHVDTITTTTNLYGSSTVPPPPATVLSLNSSSHVFDFIDNSDPLIRPSIHLPTNPVSNVTSFDSPFEGLPSFGRKRAYTNGLELERAQLLEENARLKRQQEELYLAAAAQLPKKHTLHRTSTAPF
ncbi:conserved hypothetical protein [Ricinus communis]|uniref:Protein FD n=1 Tax=Ricinus communis TaxID=3988 RepID=B9SYS3_RICCO|nr:conserved hypothetical protein [Ricinus communis]